MRGGPSWREQIEPIGHGLRRVVSQHGFLRVGLSVWTCKLEGRDDAPGVGAASSIGRAADS